MPIIPETADPSRRQGRPSKQVWGADATVGPKATSRLVRPAKLSGRTLDSIQAKAGVRGTSLCAVAGDRKLFLKQKTDISFETCSLNEVAQLLVAVHDAINVLQICRTQFDDEWLVEQGHSAGINFDVLFLANYEHLLMRLQSQLMTALSRKALDLLLLGGYDKRHHRLLSWFTEFSDKPRPLSTSLDIKPSLAVLWGVCWMFYANGQTNNGRVPSEAVLQHVDLPDWRRPESTECECMLAMAKTRVAVLIMEADRDFGFELVRAQLQHEDSGAPQRPRAGRSIGLRGGANLSLRNAETWMPANLESGVPQARQGVSRGVGSAPGWQGLGGKCADVLDSYALLPASHCTIRWVSACSVRMCVANNMI